MEENNIQISVNLSLQDYQKYNRMASLNSLTAFYAFIICAVITNIIIREMASVIYFILSLIAYETWIRVSIKRGYKLNKLTLKEKVYNFTEKGIESHAVDGSTNSKIKWDELYSVKQSKDIIYLLTGKASGLVIPRRCLNAVQIAELEELIRKKLNPKALKKPNYIKYVCLGSLWYIILTLSIGVLNIVVDRFS